MCAGFMVAISSAANGFHIAGIPFEFILFGLTLAGVALFHKHTMGIAVTGMIVITLYKTLFQEFSVLHHFIGTADHEGEWRILLNLFGLLTGFALLADHFERSHIPDHLPRILPDDWKGGLLLLFLVAALSTFLDNIAAAMIGGAITHVVYKGKVHIGYLAAIVAASNAGGAGSVLGDTTTTMMWIDGVSAFDVLHAFVASIPAICFFGIFAAKQQQRFQPIMKEEKKESRIDYLRIFIVVLILCGTITTNILLEFPAAGVWGAIIIGAFMRKTSWNILPGAVRGSIFLLSLVMCASMMPVKELPDASWQTAFILGAISSVFDNIPLTKLALNQGGYDWGLLAYAVGFGGSMIWFGSSAGVAISNMYPEAKSTAKWIKGGWHIAVGYVIGFFVMLLICGWHPHEPHK